MLENHCQCFLVQDAVNENLIEPIFIGDEKDQIKNVLKI